MFDIKKLVNAIVNRGDAPMRATESAAQLVRVLPKTEYADVLVEIVKSILKINADTEIPLKERLHTLLHVDERTQTIHQRLSEDFINGIPAAKTHLPSILAYLKELANAYTLCLRIYHGAPVPSLLDTIRLATARGLSHQMHLVLWNSLNYLKSEGDFWLHSYRLYQYAEEMGYEARAIRLYENSPQDTSCEQLLLRGAMLRLAQTDNLSPQEIFATEQLIFGLSDSLYLERSAELEAPVFSINLKAPAPPALLRRGMAGESFRYWSGQPMANQLADIILDMDKEMPQVLANARVQLSRQQWSELCMKLATRWSNGGGAVQRKSERRVESIDVEVHVGFDRCAFLTKVHALAEPDPAAGHWRVRDASSSGLGLSFHGRHDQLALGRILLVRQSDSDVKLGVIRRIAREKSGVTQVGVEVLGQMPIGVALTDPVEPDTDPANGLYITQANSNNGSRCFLLPKQLAANGRELLFSVQGLAYRVRLKALQQAFDDCVNCDFDTLARVDG